MKTILSGPGAAISVAVLTSAVVTFAILGVADLTDKLQPERVQIIPMSCASTNDPCAPVVLTAALES